MVHIDSIVSAEDRIAALDAGLVRAQFTEAAGRDVVIYNYTERATFTRTWNAATRNCRGLIVDVLSGEVLARPWPKFFNYGEHPPDTLDLSASVEVTDKLDGSLGILWHDASGMPHIATRGSFESEQARHATAVYLERHAGEWQPDPDLTYLFEIIYPGNRIVLDYGGMDDLVLLGAVDIETGVTYGPRTGVLRLGWPGPAARILEHETLGDALAAEPRANAEGVVVRFRDTGVLVKIKQDDYVSLHRMVTGLTTRRLWERVAVHHLRQIGLDAKRIGHGIGLDAGEVQTILDAHPDAHTWIGDLLARSPEEFAEWIQRTTGELWDAYGSTVDHAMAVLRQLEVDKVERREVAAYMKDQPAVFRGMVFTLLDGKSISPAAWKFVRPAAERAFVRQSEDVA